MLTLCWQQGSISYAEPSMEGSGDDDQGRLPLRQYAVRSERGASRRDALYLLALLEARRAVGVLHAGPVSPDHASRERRDLSMEQPHRQHHFCANCGCGTYSESPDWSTGKPDFENPRVGVNARLFNDFDLDAVPVTVIDGKNLW
jgi:hypothetical protein